jgi:hypothetical protein
MVQTPAKKPRKAVPAETRPACAMALMYVAGRNQNPPTATNSRPVMIPPL